MTKLNLLSKKTLLFAVFNVLLTFPFHSISKYNSNEKNSSASTFTPKKINISSSDDPLIIVIDPGHGGKDKGTSFAGFDEKDIVLEIAVALKIKLKNAIPNSKIFLTREKDQFVPLHSRIRYANNLKADVFISLHCNSYIDDQSVNGAEVHVLGLSNHNEKLNTAFRENASIFFESDRDKYYEWNDPDSPEAFIFFSTFQNLFLDESINIAAKMCQSKIGIQTFKQRGVKQSGLLVLRNATMPAILVETGYLSNDTDRNTMTSVGGQNQIAAWLANALMEHFIFDKKGIVMNK
ncbi:MAG: N-acetylmuramoyl-L-alanine amidase family protein [Deltaproteobacteria bacterium]